MATAKQQLQNLTDALVEDIMSMTDDEILAECIEDGEDPDEIVKRMQDMIDVLLDRMEPT